MLKTAIIGSSMIKPAGKKSYRNSFEDDFDRETENDDDWFYDEEDEEEDTLFDELIRYGFQEVNKQKDAGYFMATGSFLYHSPGYSKNEDVDFNLLISRNKDGSIHSQLSEGKDIILDVSMASVRDLKDLLNKIITI